MMKYSTSGEFFQAFLPHNGGCKMDPARQPQRRGGSTINLTCGSIDQYFIHRNVSQSFAESFGWALFW